MGGRELGHGGSGTKHAAGVRGASTAPKSKKTNESKRKKKPKVFYYSRSKLEETEGGDENVGPVFGTKNSCHTNKGKSPPCRNFWGPHLTSEEKGFFLTRVKVGTSGGGGREISRGSARVGFFVGKGVPRALVHTGGGSEVGGVLHKKSVTGKKTNKEQAKPRAKKKKGGRYGLGGGANWSLVVPGGGNA